MSSVSLAVRPGRASAPPASRPGSRPSGTPDLALVVNDGPATHAAAVFTTNRVEAAPGRLVAAGRRRRARRRRRAQLRRRERLHRARGLPDTHRTAEHVAEVLGVSAGDVVVCSTGLIGELLPMDQLLGRASTAAAAALVADGGEAAADRDQDDRHGAKSRHATRGDGWSVGGMAKGAGMLAPALATMLVVLTTDAVVDAARPRPRRCARRPARPFDRIDSDGCMSTNDTVAAARQRRRRASAVGPSELDRGRVTAVCADLARQLIADAEGADHDIAIEVVARPRGATPLEVARAVARSNLFKCAVFGKDPNWGRVLAAVGTTSRRLRPARPRRAINGVQVCRAGGAGEDRSLVDLTGREVHVVVDLHAGTPTATVWTNDLTARLRPRELGLQHMTTTRAHRPPRPHRRRRAPRRRGQGRRRSSRRCRGSSASAARSSSSSTAATPWSTTTSRRAFAEDVAFLRYAGLRPVVVHGGGPQINAMLDRLGLESEFKGGLRVTTPEAMDVVRMVLTGQVRPRARRAAQRSTARSPWACRARTPACSRRPAPRHRRRRRARSTSGSSATSRASTRRPSSTSSTPGGCRSSRRVARPDGDGQVLNVNADTAAAALAVALGAEKLVVLTDVEGLYADWPDRATLLSTDRRRRARAAAARAVERAWCRRWRPACGPSSGACPRPTSIDGRLPHAMLLEVFTAEGVGTHGPARQ